MRHVSILAVFAAFLMLSGAAFAKCEDPTVPAIWLDANNKVLYPPNGGASGTVTPIMLPPGMVLDRYGCETGRYFGARGAKFEARSLPYDCKDAPYFVYRVNQPVLAWTAQAAPWFNQPGGATQFQTDASVAQLLADGVIEKIDADKPACGK